jgi:hypothetical protein
VHTVLIVVDFKDTPFALAVDCKVCTVNDRVSALRVCADLDKVPRILDAFLTSSLTPLMDLPVLGSTYLPVVIRFAIN